MPAVLFFWLLLLGCWADRLCAVSKNHSNNMAPGMHFFGGPAAPQEEPVYALSDHETEKARYWLPCIDLPTVRTTAEFHLTTQAAHRAFANGVKRSEVKFERVGFVGLVRWFR